MSALIGDVRYAVRQLAGLMSGILVNVSATDPAVYVGVTALLVSVAALANYLPARRAATLDPIEALRGE